MSVPADLPHLIAYIILPLVACVVVAGLLLAHAIYVQSTQTASRESSKETHRACRYCRKGSTVLVEQTVRYEGAEVVQTQCFACARCGLPQWVVTRTPHEWRAVR